MKLMCSVEVFSTSACRPHSCISSSWGWVTGLASLWCSCDLHQGGVLVSPCPLLLLTKSRLKGREWVEGWRETVGGTRGAGGEGLRWRSLGEDVSDGGAEQWEDRGGGVSWEGGGGSRPLLAQLPGRDRWGPWQGERDGEEERDMEKEREGEGVWETRGGWSCGDAKNTPLLEEAWRLWRTADSSGTPSLAVGRLEWVWSFMLPTVGLDRVCGDAEEETLGLFGELWVGRRHPGKSTPSMSPLSNREWVLGLWREQDVAGGGNVIQAPDDNWLVLLGGGVKFGIMVIRIGGDAVWRRGFSRRVISCSSWLSLETCLERLFICRARTHTHSC